jgi:hypothetical protein
MSDEPVGETPGWTGPFWFNFEVSQASTWNIPAKFNDTAGNTYNYKGMFEQSSAIGEIGFEVIPSWLAFSIEVPYANHNSGFFSDFVRQFHWAVGSDTFERPSYPGYQDTYQIGYNNVDQFQTDRPEGVSNLKFKLKLWLLNWMGDDAGSCDCGLAVSAQLKAPVAPANQGLTSGSTDISELIHLGIPLFSHSGIWFTAAFTQLGNNESMLNWPTRHDQEMYEMATDIGLTDSGFGFMFTARYISPALNGEGLTFNDGSVTDPLQLAADREASGWNGLVYWRGAEAIGFRQRFQNGWQINFLFQEDFAIGNMDGRSDGLYINDAPDFSFILQFHLVL